MALGVRRRTRRVRCPEGQVDSFKKGRHSLGLNTAERSNGMGMPMGCVFSNLQVMVTLTRAILCQLMGVKC